MASTTPARNVPNAGESPTTSIKSAIPTTIRSAVAVKSSRSPAAAMKRNTGVVRYDPPITTAATAAKVTSAVCQPFRPSTRLIAGPCPPSSCPASAAPWAASSTPCATTAA